MTDGSPRIALLGFNLESNRYALVAGRRNGGVPAQAPTALVRSQ